MRTVCWGQSHCHHPTAFRCPHTSTTRGLLCDATAFLSPLRLSPSHSPLSSFPLVLSLRNYCISASFASTQRVSTSCHRCPPANGNGWRRSPAAVPSGPVPQPDRRRRRVRDFNHERFDSGGVPRGRGLGDGGACPAVSSAPAPATGSQQRSVPSCRSIAVLGDDVGCAPPCGAVHRPQ